MAKQKKVTTIEELKRYKEGTEVELPPFAEGQPFVARLKRPSIMKMMESGEIPNSLIVRANQLFLTGTDEFNPHQENVVKEIYPVLKEVAKHCFVDPTWKSMEEAGIELTDEQLMFLFSYMQDGVRTLESFRAKQEGYIGHSASETV